MRILIPGGCGFVGTNLALHLSAKGQEVICVDNYSRAGVELNGKRLVKAGVRVIRKAIQELDGKEVSPEIILNCAAQSGATKGMTNPVVDFKCNLESVVSSLEIARECGSAFIQWSTNKVYPSEPINERNMVEEETRYRVDWLCPLTIDRLSGSRSIYGATKAAAEILIEEWARAFGIPTIINRFSCLAGPYQLGCAEQGWVAAFIIHHMLGRPLTYYGWKGKQVRDVLAATDLCELVEKQVHYLVGGRKGFSVYNVGGGTDNSISLMETVDLCAKIVGKRVEVVEGPQRWADHRVYVSDIYKVCNTFGWKPKIGVRENLESIKEWALEEREFLVRLNQ